MTGLLNFGRSQPKVKRLRIEPHGGELRPSTIVPTAVAAKLASKESMIVVLLLSATTLGALNISLSLVIQSRAIAVPYVADGSPFGCRVEVPSR